MFCEWRKKRRGVSDFMHQFIFFILFCRTSSTHESIQRAIFQYNQLPFIKHWVGTVWCSAYFASRSVHTWSTEILLFALLVIQIEQLWSIGSSQCRTKSCAIFSYNQLYIIFLRLRWSDEHKTKSNCQKRSIFIEIRVHLICTILKQSVRILIMWSNGFDWTSRCCMDQKLHIPSSK